MTVVALFRYTIMLRSIIVEHNSVAEKVPLLRLVSAALIPGPSALMSSKEILIQDWPDGH